MRRSATHSIQNTSERTLKQKKEGTACAVTASAFLVVIALLSRVVSAGAEKREREQCPERMRAVSQQRATDEYRREWSKP